jgi:hypothetical protein
MSLIHNGFAAFALFAALTLASVALPAGVSEPTPIGRIERLDPRLDRLIAPEAELERVSTGYAWAEGPLWDARDGSLLFSDVPRNNVLRWTESAGTSLFLRASGYAGRSRSRAASRARTVSRSTARAGSCCASTASAASRGSSATARSRRWPSATGAGG